ncbi:hypothetical protein [Frankia sp. Cr2]|uniref:hypothetical protein n=1 Tax=Frankia sp. Cr2 TaxID=3073932 RepID=UPI002AD1EF60|nr:hypothetical protein [Frankia sp. Cr2]
MASVMIVTVPTYHSPTHVCGVGDFGCDGDRSYLPLPGPGHLPDAANPEGLAVAAPSAEASRHLRWLRDERADRFVAGVVLHTGPRLFQLDDRIVAAPICAL